MICHLIYHDRIQQATIWNHLTSRNNRLLMLTRCEHEPMSGNGAFCVQRAVCAVREDKPSGSISLSERGRLISFWILSVLCYTVGNTKLSAPVWQKKRLWQEWNDIEKQRSIQADVEANPELQSLIEQSRMEYKSGKAQNTSEIRKYFANLKSEGWCFNHVFAQKDGSKNG